MAKYSGFEKVSADRSAYGLDIQPDEISFSDYRALVGIARARLILSTVPYTLDVSQSITNLEAKLPLSGTPLSRQVFAAAHANYNTENVATVDYYSKRDFSDPLEREGTGSVFS